MEVYGNGEVTSNENWIYEYDLPSSIRYVHTGNLNGRTFQIEEIDIGRIKYCKKDKADWNRVKDFCIFAPARGFEDKTSLKYTLEKVIFNGKDANLYTQYNTYKNIFSKNKDSEGLSYDETKYWLNKDGLLLLEEYKSGLIAPKTVNWVRIVTHEYNPKDLKIGAPIK